MRERTILAQDWKLGQRYYGVMIAVYERYVPIQYPGAEIALHPSSLSAKHLGRKKIISVNLSWGHQERYSDEYSMRRMAWKGGMKLWHTLMLCPVSQIVRPTRRRLPHVEIIYSPNYESYHRGTVSWWEGLQFRRSGLRYVSEK